MYNHEKAEKTFLDYASRYDMEDPKIRLKADHTLRVAALCGQIAREIGLSDEDCDIAWMMGLLHDIGRFEQVRIYHTFKDSLSVNHAHFSAKLLFEQGLIRDYTEDQSNDALLKTAIREHNAYRLPDDLTVREKTFCQILRDADKIDILRVNRETPMTQIYDLPEEAFLTSEISETVFADLMAHRDVNRANSQTGIDFLMGHIAFVFGLVYPVSFRLVKEQGYLAQMLAVESRNEKTRRQMDAVRREVGNYIRERTGGMTDAAERECQVTCENMAESGRKGMENMNNRALIVQQAEELIREEPWYVSALSSVAAFLWETLPEINWVGFYLMRGGRLTVGPFQGKTACIHIPVGKGVCGTCVERESAVIVPDVHAFPGHIACDSASRSEIVLPVRSQGKVIGVLDIDSPREGRFTEADLHLLTEIVRVIEEQAKWED